MRRPMPSFLRHIARAIRLRFHSATPTSDEDWTMVTGNYMQDIPWAAEPYEEMSPVLSEALVAGRRLRAHRAQSNLSLSRVGNRNDSVVLSDQSALVDSPSTMELDHPSPMSLSPRVSVVSVDAEQHLPHPDVNLNREQYRSSPISTRPADRPSPERAELYWQPINDTYERQMVEIIQSDGSSRFLPIEGSTRIRSSTPQSYREDRHTWLAPKPVSAAVHLNSASFSGSDVPYDQLYQLELDWVMSHEEETSLRARLLGVLHDQPGSSPGRLVKRPTTWSVVQRNEIPVDAHSSPLDWLSGGILGEGTYSRVYLVFHKPSGKELAMKTTYMKRPLPAVVCDGIANELRVLEILSRQEKPLPFVLRPSAIAQKWAWTSTDGFIHILTEFCPGGDLFEYKGSLSEESLRCVIAELVLAIESLHELGIIHHDIKPENILVDADGHCVLTDFGGSKFLKNGKIKLHPSGHIVATLPYAAPELLKDVVTEEYDASVDWWSLGSTILTLLTGHEYFSMESRKRLRDVMPLHIQNVRYTMELYDECPAELIDLVEELLQVDPSMRPTGPAIRCHPYFAKLPYTWDLIARRLPGIASPIPVIHSVPARRQGTKSTCKDWPSHFDHNDPNQCYLLAELRKEGLALAIDNSCDVLVMHHQAMRA